MDLMDVFLLVIYFTLAIFAGRYIVSAKGKHNPLYRKWFMKGLMFKLVGGTLFALVYTFYYTYGGDTRSYFRFGEVVDEFIVDHPTQALTSLLENSKMCLQNAGMRKLMLIILPKVSITWSISQPLFHSLLSILIFLQLSYLPFSLL